MKKLKLSMLLVFALSFGIAYTQPPPPQPGGSGNQGAPISPISMTFLAIAGSALFAIKSNHQKQ